MKRLLSTIGALFATLAVVFTLTAVPAAQAASQTVSPSVTPTVSMAGSPSATYGRTAQRATNVARAKRDLVKLKRDSCLKKFARSHARAMARAQTIWHQDMGTVLNRCGVSMVGENVAAGYATGRAVVKQGWMKSPGHRENILRREFRLGVVAAAMGSDGRWYATQLFGRR